MELFLTEFCSFEAQLRSRAALREARKDATHKDFGEALPRLIPPSLVKLWQCCLAQCHSEFYSKHFGDLSVNRLANNPLGVIAARAGVDMELSDIPSPT